MINTSSSTLKDRRPWLVLAVGLLVTFAVTLLVKSGVERIAAIEFNARCDVIRTKIEERLDDYARLLRNGVALFGASEKVTREQWRLFIHAQGKLEQQLPGIQAIAFSLLIPPRELPRHIRELRSEGFPSYTVKPSGERTLYSSIIFMEPFSGRNLRAFGYDMLSEPVRRRAMEQARDTDSPTLSGKITLLHEDSVDIQSGALMYLPVYYKGLPHETVTQRRAALMGWVLSPYRMGELMQGILGREVENKTDLHVQLFDSGDQSPQTLLYENHPGENKKQLHPAHVTRRIQAYGRLWTLNFIPRDGGFFSAPYLVVWLTMTAGVAISLLLFALGRSLLNTRSRAEALAQTMTRDLRNSEKQLILSNREWRDTFDTIPDLIAIIDTSYRITRANAAMSAAMKKNGTDNPGASCYQAFHCTNAPLANCPHHRLMIDGLEHSSTNYEERLGGWYQITATPIFDEAGKVVGSIHVAHDVTEPKEREQKLLQSETKYRQLHGRLIDALDYAENIVESVREPLVVLDANLKILTVNQSFYATFRVTPEETVGNFIYDLGNRQWDAPPLRLLLENILTHETQFNGYEMEHEFPGIGKKTILLNARQIFRENISSPHVILLAMEDITRRKKLQGEFLLQEQAKTAAIRRLAAGVAHELNNPLGFISSNLRVLADYFHQIVRFDRFRRDLDAGDSGSAHGEAVTTQREKLEIDSILDDGADLISGTLRGAERVAKIVRGLKNYSLVEPLGKEPLTLEPCLESALTLCRDELQLMTTIRKEYEPTPPVSGNREQLEQLFLNLLLNAGQAIAEQGEIVLKSYCDEGFVYVSVRDTGRGIPLEVQERIFDPFFTTREVGQGTGLGLSISAEIVRKHDGELLVASVVGVGTTFTVKLPRTPVA